MSDDKNKKIDTGIMLGKANGVKIKECEVSGKIYAYGVTTDISAGGIAGEAKKTDIINSSCNVDIIIDEDRQFDDLKGIIAKNIKEKDKVKELIELVEEMKQEKRTNRYLETYKNFMSVLSDHITVIGAAVTVLTRFFPK